MFEITGLRQGLGVMEQSNVPAIVFGGGLTGLGLVRGLGKEGIDVYGVVDSGDPLISSKYCRKRFIMSDCTQKIDLLRSALQWFRREIGSRAVVFSTDDAGTLGLAHLQQEMSDAFSFVVPPEEVAQTLVDKSKFYASLEESQIPYPRVLLPRSDHDAKLATRELGLPLYIRPMLSQHFFKEFRAKGFLAASESEAERYYRVARRRRVDVFFQEIILGPDTNMYGIAGVVNKASEPIALFAYHRLRGWPPFLGNSSLMESVSLAGVTGLRDTITRYVNLIRYRGIFDAEFKLDPRDGRHKLLEINARPWWQNAFATRCGLNIPLIAYLESAGFGAKPLQLYTAGVRWVNLLDDIRSSLTTGQIAKAGWLRSLVGVREYAYFDGDDPAPAARYLMTLLDSLRFQRRTPGLRFARNYARAFAGTARQSWA